MEKKRLAWVNTSIHHLSDTFSNATASACIYIYSRCFLSVPEKLQITRSSLLDVSPQPFLVHFASGETGDGDRSEDKLEDQVAVLLLLSLESDSSPSDISSAVGIAFADAALLVVERSSILTCRAAQESFKSDAATMELNGFLSSATAALIGAM